MQRCGIRYAIAVGVIVTLFFLVSAVVPAVAEAQASPGSLASETVLNQAERLLRAGDQEKSFVLLESKLDDPENGVEIARFYAEALASSALKLLQGTTIGKMPAASASICLAYLRRARDLQIDQPKYWILLLETMAAASGEQTSFLTESYRFFRRFDDRLGSAPISGSDRLLKEWDKRFAEKSNPLEKWWLLRARGESEPGKKELEALESRIRKRLPELRKRFQELISRSELPAADFVLSALQRIDQSTAGLQEMQTKLERVQKIQDLLTKAAEALKAGKAEECRSLCQSVFAIDPNNSSARELLKKIEETQRVPGQDLYGGSNRTGGAVPSKELLQKLAKAEQEEDFGEARRILKELGFQGMATAEHVTRLKELDTEIENARMNIESRWREAQTLLDRQKWTELRRLLNRNPVFSAPERVMDLEEMGLCCAHFLALRDADKVQADAESLLKRFPKSFWAAVVLMDQALNRNDFVTARKYYDMAVVIKPGHATLRWPRIILWLQMHGWKIVPLVLIVLFYIIAHSLPTIFAFIESLYWPWIRMLIRVAPSFALGSLEGRIGRIRETEQKRQQYELMTQAAFRAGISDKGVRYAQLTLEIDHENPLAIDALGSYFLGRPEGFAQQLDIIVRFVNRHLQDKKILEKFVQQMLQRRDLKPEMLPIVKKYLAYCPQHTEVITFAAEVLRSWRATDVGREGMDLLEKSFQISRDADLGQILWRVYVACGMRDQAVALSASMVAEGHSIDMLGLLDRLEEDIDQKVLFLQQAVMGMDKARQIEAMQAILELHHVTMTQAARLIQPLEGFEAEADVNVKFHAQKARDHLKRVSLECKTFRDRLRALPSSPTPSASSVQSIEPTGLEPLVEPDQVLAQPGQPEMPAEIPAGESVIPSSDNPLNPSPADSAEAEDEPFDPFRTISPQPTTVLDAVPDVVALPPLDSVPSEPDLMTSPTLDLQPTEPPLPEEVSVPAPVMADVSTGITSIEQRLFADLQAYGHDDSTTTVSGQRPPSQDLFADLPPRFVDGDERQPNLPDLPDELAPVSTDSPLQQDRAEEPVSSEAPLVGLPPLSETPPAESVKEVTPVDLETSLEAGLSDLILGLGESPSADQLSGLCALMTDEDWPAWDTYLQQPHEDATLCAVIPALAGLKLDGAQARILPFLRHASSTVRDCAVESLAASGSKDVLPELAARLADAMPEVREGALRVLSGYDHEKLLPEMKNWISSSDVEKRDLAIRLLKSVRINESAAMLQTLLYDSEAVIRRNAIRALAFQALPGNARMLHEYLDVCTDAEEEKLIAKAIDFIENQRTDSPFQE